MPRSFTFFALAATAIVLAGCVPRHYYENLYAVARGMTKTEVQAALGPANTVRTKDHLSAWQYCDEFSIWGSGKSGRHCAKGVRSRH